MSGGKALHQASTVVVKVGSQMLVRPHDGRVRRQWLEALAKDCARIHARKGKLIVVSSGAITLGRKRLGLAEGTLSLADSQAAAAAGQVDLARVWREAFAPYGIQTAQVLLTPADTEQRQRYLNARTTLTALMHHKVVPIVNENDTVATEELRYGDNDRLAARVASMVSAECMVLLSGVDGLYTVPPPHPEARLVEVVEAITPEVVAMAGETPDAYARGGMKTKIMAAQIAIEAGCHMLIADGRRREPLKALEENKSHTWFRATATPTRARKRWIAGSLAVRGTLHVDEGAARALARGASLLSAGVVRTEGVFDKGEAVAVLDPEGKEIGRGLVAYHSHEVERLLGRKSDEREAILGYCGPADIIHRDDLALHD